MGENHNISIVKKTDAEYPDALLKIKNPPQSLYCIGDVSLMKQKCLAVVGSRKCSEYGRQTAMKIGKTAAENEVVIVSGMAKGIDSFGHLGALRNGGKTIAVLGGGVNVCYPASNRRLYEEICEKGLVISETEPDIIWDSVKNDCHTAVNTTSFAGTTNFSFSLYVFSPSLHPANVQFTFEKVFSGSIISAPSS